jgi:hypothetical protein
VGIDRAVPSRVAVHTRFPLLPAHFLGASRAVYRIAVLAALALPSQPAGVTDDPTYDGGRHRRPCPRWTRSLYRQLLDSDRSTAPARDLAHWDAFLGYPRTMEPESTVRRLLSIVRPSTYDTAGGGGEGTRKRMIDIRRSRRAVSRDPAAGSLNGPAG